MTASTTPSSAPPETPPSRSSFSQRPHSPSPTDTFRSSPALPSATKTAAYLPSRSPFPKAILESSSFPKSAQPVALPAVPTARQPPAVLLPRSILPPVPTSPSHSEPSPESLAPRPVSAAPPPHCCFCCRCTPTHPISSQASHSPAHARYPPPATRTSPHPQ